MFFHTILPSDNHWLFYFCLIPAGHKNLSVALVPAKEKIFYKNKLAFYNKDIFLVDLSSKFKMIFYPCQTARHARCVICDFSSCSWKLITLCNSIKKSTLKS